MNKISPNRLLIALVFAAAATHLVVSSQASTFPASASVSLTCGNEGLFQIGGPPGNYTCSGLYVGDDASVVLTDAAALITDGINPSISVSATTNNAIENVDPEMAASRSLQDMTYYFVVESLAPAPFAIDNVPLFFSASAGGSADLGHSFSGGVFIINSAGVGIGEEFNQDDPELQFDFADSFLVGIDYRVTLEADCFSTSPVLGESSCEAHVSSSLDFNQTLFDQIYGNEAFLLSDYYRINLSSNLTTVPIPAAIWLFTGALGMLSVFRSKTAITRT